MPNSNEPTRTYNDIPPLSAAELAAISARSSTPAAGTGYLTNAELRASPVAVSGTVAISNSSVEISNDVGNSVPISATTLPLPSGAATAANQVTSNTSLSSIDGKLPALDNSKVAVIPSLTSGGNLSVTTAAVGTNWTTFSSQALKQLTVSNQSNFTLEFQQGAAGVGFQIPTGTFYTFFGITNANQIGVRRVDVSNTQVVCTARWEN